MGHLHKVQHWIHKSSSKANSIRSAVLRQTYIRQADLGNGDSSTAVPCSACRTASSGGQIVGVRALRCQADL